MSIATGNGNHSHKGGIGSEKFQPLVRTRESWYCKKTDRSLHNCMSWFIKHACMRVLFSLLKLGPQDGLMLVKPESAPNKACQWLQVGSPKAAWCRENTTWTWNHIFWVWILSLHFTSCLILTSYLTSLDLSSHFSRVVTRI